MDDGIRGKTQEILDEKINIWRFREEGGVKFKEKGMGGGGRPGKTREGVKGVGVRRRGCIISSALRC